MEKSGGAGTRANHQILRSIPGRYAVGLLPGYIDLRLARPFETPDPYVAYYADDHTIVVSDLDAPPERALRSPVASNERLADDRHIGRVVGVNLGDVTPVEEGNPHRRKETGGYEAQARRVLLTGVLRSPFDFDGPDAAPIHHRQEAGVSRAGNARKLARRGEDLPVETIACGGFLISRYRERGAERENAIGDEAGINRPDTPKRPRQKTEPDQQDDAAGNFGDDERRTEPLAAAANAGASTFAELGCIHAAGLAAKDAERGNNAETDTGETDEQNSE
jgi:hypothetical protein